MNLKGKTAIFLGDSITEGAGTSCEENRYYNILKRRCELNEVVGYGVGGTRIAIQSKPSEVERFDRHFSLRADEMQKNADIVVVFGGTNDSWSNAPLGEIKYSGWEEKDLFSVLPAVCYFLNLLKETLPQTKIYCLINTEIKPEIASCMKNACKEYGITPVSFDKIDKTSGHPTIQGMKDIKNSVLKVINK